MKATEAKNPRATLSESNLNGFLSCIYDLRTGRKKVFPKFFIVLSFSIFPHLKVIFHYHSSVKKRLSQSFGVIF